jgi:hypothetical protein
VIVFRHADPRFPFLWESADQPPGRWHGPGEGPAHYFAGTPDGAWAEFLRHEEITDPVDLATVDRALWAVELGRPPAAAPALDPEVLAGDPASYEACRAEARRMRARGERGLVAPSAALLPGTPSGFRVEGALQPGPPRAERVVVLFGRRSSLVGWAACATGRPRPDLLRRVRHFGTGTSGLG